ncbi:MAG: molybdopterin converting factor small subunit [Myxococcota bacterium]|jgi:molybdopterin converting factor small subunit
MNSVNVSIPTPLRRFLAGARTMKVEADTVGGVFASMIEAHPALHGRILDEAGGLRSHLNIYVGDEDIRQQSGLQTPVRDGDQITIVAALAGG